MTTKQYTCISFVHGSNAMTQETLITTSPESALNLTVIGADCYIVALIFEFDQFSAAPSGHPLLAWAGHAQDYDKLEDRRSNEMTGDRS